MTQYVTHAQLNDIIHRYRDLVYGIALSKTTQPADADDVFQEVFIKLIRHIDHIRSEEHLKAWLIRVTLNCCNNLFRSSWTQRMSLFGSGTSGGGA